MDVPEITDLELKVGTDRLLPKLEDIPVEFKNETSKWNTLYDHILNNNKQFLRLVTIIPNPAVGTKKASKAMKVIMAHAKWEGGDAVHRRAGVSFMMSQYFSDWIVNNIT